MTAMQSYDADVGRIVEHIWTTFLDLSVLPTEPVLARAMERDGLSGTIHISGAWHGAVVLHCSAPLARCAAGILFGVPADAADTADVHDALGELTNMAGGNIKALMPEPCLLSLPTVGDARAWKRETAGSRQVAEVAYECLGEPLRVAVYERQG